MPTCCRRRRWKASWRPAPTRPSTRATSARSSQGVNDTLDAVIGPLNVAAEYVDRISKGDIPAKITDNYNGDFNEIKNNLNQCIDAVNALVADADMLSKAAVEGKLATRADATKHQGDFRKIVAGRERDARRGDRPVERGGRVRRPDLQGRHPAEDHRQLQRRLQRDQEQPEPVHRRGQRPDRAKRPTLAKAAVEGRPGQQADDAKFQGKYREIIHGMNKTLEGFAEPINDIGEVLKRLANKDFSQAVETEYPGAYGELRDNVNLVVTSIRGAIEQINESGGQFAEGSRVIAESSQTLAAGAQDAELQRREMTASIEELARSVRRVKDNATRSRQGGQGDQPAGRGRRQRPCRSRSSRWS